MNIAVTVALPNLQPGSQGLSSCVYKEQEEERRWELGSQIYCYVASPSPNERSDIFFIHGKIRGKRIKNSQMFLNKILREIFQFRCQEQMFLVE